MPRRIPSLLVSLCLLLCLAPGATVLGAVEKKQATGSEINKPIDLNQAGEAELRELPGIGPAMAKRILQFREDHGRFKRVEDLLKVKGIGEKSFQKLRPHITVSGSKSR